MASITIQTGHPYSEFISINFSSMDDIVLSPIQKDELKNQFIKLYLSFYDNARQERSEYLSKIRENVQNEKRKYLQAECLIESAEQLYQKSKDRNNTKWRMDKNILNYAIANADESNKLKILGWLSNHTADNYFCDKE